MFWWDVLDMMLISRMSCFMGASSVVIVFRAMTRLVRLSLTLYTAPPAPSPRRARSSR